MPEINALHFTHMELLKLLIKEAGVHEGRWLLSLNFGFTAGNFGPTADQVLPGAVITVANVGIAKATPETPDALVLDAAAVNPPSARAKPKK